MHKTQGLVINIKRPTVAASTDVWEVQVLIARKLEPYLNENTGEIIRPIKKEKRWIFCNFLPALHTWIELALL
jgi:hypothetical protein